MSTSRLILIIVTLVIIFGALTFIIQNTSSTKPSEKLFVVTTLFPLYDMAREIGGTYTETTLLLPPGMSPHNYEPTPSDIMAITHADVFIYTGPFMEPWVADLLAGIDTSHMTIVNASTHADIHHEDGEDEQAHESEEAHEAEEHDHDHEAGDPHIWLSPHNAHVIANDIGTALVEALPSHSVDIANARDTYLAKLDAVFAAYETGLSSCDTRTIIYGGHYAFGYIAEAFDLHYVAAQGYSPDAEPSASALATLSDIVKKENATAIFTDALESPAIADTLARETGATVHMLNPAGNIGKDARDNGVSFITILETNLATLRAGLRCK
ncbi:MAG: zinc ABC transporter substrate-binding protein [Candidatus Yonathbacteria bacterium]|nr:zinc ABC transporter substrate-binding protein [Candidatus Yonathbacteria bacterium]NTW47412.1 zinc ABC transporter substrate-binding protein [Candidatus Yonathbacteria bacterium]